MKEFSLNIFYCPYKKHIQHFKSYWLCIFRHTQLVRWRSHIFTYYHYCNAIKIIIILTNIYITTQHWSLAVKGARAEVLTTAATGIGRQSNTFTKRTVKICKLIITTTAKEIKTQCTHWNLKSASMDRKKYLTDLKCESQKTGGEYKYLSLTGWFTESKKTIVLILDTGSKKCSPRGFHLLNH